MDWKTLVYEYAYARNQMEAQYDPGHVASYIEDDLYYSMQKERTSRLAQLHRLRKIEPIRRESRLRILSARCFGNGLAIEIGLHDGFDYKCNGQFHKEEKKEIEKVMLSSRHGQWTISAIHPRQLDGLFREGTQEIEAAGQATEIKLPLGIGSMTTPLLDERIGRSRLFREISYDRKRAAAYADLWWESGNPAYLEFSVDCSNYVSQCIFAGGAPMNYTNKRGAGWWYRGKSGSQELWSYSWAVADSLKRFLSNSREGLRAKLVNSPQQLAEGDVISYSWNGDGHYGHSTVVTAMDGNGMPLVNAHTVSSKHRYWDYKDSYAWTENTQYCFFHINDSLHY